MSSKIKIKKKRNKKKKTIFYDGKDLENYFKNTILNETTSKIEGEKQIVFQKEILGTTCNVDEFIFKHGYFPTKEQLKKFQTSL